MPASDGKYTSIWSRPARPERSTLTREQIVTEAIALLDGDGIDALSMRKLAARLNAGATSLYWHVANREELITLVIDQIYGEVEIPDARGTTDWRTATTGLAHSTRDAFHRHPWLVSVLDHLVGASTGPNLMKITERMITLLQRAGFGLKEAEQVMSTVSAYSLGIAISEVAWRDWMERNQPDKTTDEWLAEGLAAAEAAAKDYPRTQELYALYADVDPYQSANADYEYGLERLLDGIAARLSPPG